MALQPTFGYRCRFNDFATRQMIGCLFTKAVHKVGTSSLLNQWLSNEVSEMLPRRVNFWPRMWSRSSPPLLVPLARELAARSLCCSPAGGGPLPRGCGPRGPAGEGGVHHCGGRRAGLPRQGGEHGQGRHAPQAGSIPPGAQEVRGRHGAVLGVLAPAQKYHDAILSIRLRFNRDCQN